MNVIVIGAGAIGLSCAYYLAQAGADVTVLDAAAPGAGASRRNAGWIVPSMSDPVPSPHALQSALRWAGHRDSPLRIRPSIDPARIAFLGRMLLNCNRRAYEGGLRAIAELNRTTRQAYDQLEANGLRFEHHRSGVLLAFTSSATIDSHLAELEALAEFGTPPGEYLSPTAARALEPALSDAVVGAILSPAERYLNPASFVDAIATGCTDLGVTIVENTRISELDIRAGRATAALGDTTWHADAFVLAAGVWSPGVMRAAGIKLPVQAGKGYGYDYTPAPVELKHAIYLADHRVAVTPLDSGVRICGTMEFSGVDDAVDTMRARAIVRAAGQYFEPWPTTPPPTPWAGLRPMTPDGLPIIGLLPGLRNVAVATGHAMSGMTLAPVTGQNIARLIVDGEDTPALRPFAPSRFRALTRSATT